MRVRIMPWKAIDLRTLPLLKTVTGLVFTNDFKVFLHKSIGKKDSYSQLSVRF